MLAVKKRQYLTDQSGKRVGVLLDLKTFKQIEEELDELACIRAYDAAKPEADAAMKRGEYVTIQQYVARRASKKRGKRDGSRK